MTHSAPRERKDRKKDNSADGSFSSKKRPLSLFSLFFILYGVFHANLIFTIGSLVSSDLK